MSSLAMEMSKVPGPISRAKLKTIKEIQFGIFSPEEIKGFSVAHIQYPETMVCSVKVLAWNLRLTCAG
jgi:hypothetical protein